MIDRENPPIIPHLDHHPASPKPFFAALFCHSFCW